VNTTMLTTPHALVGIYLATNFPPIVGLPAALISHFVFDFFFPHWNPHLYTEMSKKGKISKNSWKWIIGDGIVAGLFCFLWAVKTFPNINLVVLGASGAFLSSLPDLVEIPYYFLNSKNDLLKKYIQFEHRYQFNASPFWGLLSQLVVLIACLTLLF